MFLVLREKKRGREHCASHQFRWPHSIPANCWLIIFIELTYLTVCRYIYHCSCLCTLPVVSYGRDSTLVVAMFDVVGVMCRT